jgi:hypothetical protein
MKKRIAAKICFGFFLMIDPVGPGLLAANPPDGAAADSPVPPANLRSASVPEGPGPHINPYSSLVTGPSVFLPDVQVNIDPGNLIDDFGPAIAVSRTGVIYVAWNGDETTKQIVVARSTDGGVTFSPAVPVNDAVAYPPSFSVYQPDIALDADDNVYVVWHDYRAWVDDYAYTSPIDVYMDKSTDGGATWGTDVLVSTNSTGSYPWHFQPYIAIDANSGNVYVSFTDYDRYYPVGDYGDVSFSRSIDGGAAFQPRIRVDDTPDSLLVVQEFSSVAVDAVSGDVFVAFEDGRGSGTDIYAAPSTDSGVTFSANVRVNVDTTSIQEQPTVTVDHSGGVFVAWLDWRDDPDPTSAPFLNHVMVGRSTDAGATFSPGVQVTDVYMDADYGYDFPPRLAADNGGGIHVVWFDTRVDTTLCYYDHSSDGGLTFGTDAILHDDVDSLSHALPRITIDAQGNPVATWMDQRNGNDKFDVFFTGPDGSTGIAGTGTSPHRLGQNYPNPFNPFTTIRYTVGEYSRVRIGIYDVGGQLIRTLVDRPRAEGEYTTFWDGRDDRGEPVSSGVYFYRLEAGATTLYKKLVLLR